MGDIFSLITVNSLPFQILQKTPEDNEPQPAPKKGCRGSIVGLSSISLMLILICTVILYRKNKENESEV